MSSRMRSHRTEGPRNTSCAERGGQPQNHERPHRQTCASAGSPRTPLELGGATYRSIGPPVTCHPDTASLSQAWRSLRRTSLPPSCLRECTETISFQPWASLSSLSSEIGLHVLPRLLGHGSTRLRSGCTRSLLRVDVCIQAALCCHQRVPFAN